MCGYLTYQLWTVLLLCIFFARKSNTFKEVLNYNKTSSSATSTFTGPSRFPSSTAFYAQISNDGKTQDAQLSSAKENIFSINYNSTATAKSADTQPVLPVSMLTSEHSTKHLTQATNVSKLITFIPSTMKSGTVISRNSDYIHSDATTTASTDTSLTARSHISRGSVQNPGTSKVTTYRSTDLSVLAMVRSAQIYPAPPAKTSTEATTTASTNVSRTTLTLVNTAVTTSKSTDHSQLTTFTGKPVTLINSLPASVVTVNVAGNPISTLVNVFHTSVALSSPKPSTNSATTSIGFKLSGRTNKIKFESTTAKPRISSPKSFTSVTPSGNDSHSKTSQFVKTSTHKNTIPITVFSHSTEITTKGNIINISTVAFSDTTPLGNNSSPNAPSTLKIHTNDTKRPTTSYPSTPTMDGKTRNHSKYNTNLPPKSYPQTTEPTMKGKPSNHSKLISEAATVNNSTAKTPPLVKIHIKKDKVMPKAFSHRLVVTFIVIYIFIIFLAFFGNLLVIFVITWARMVRSFTDLFIVSLAVSDILISTINMPIQLNLIVINEWEMGDFFCKFTHYLQAVTIVANILTLTAIAIDRYLVICHTEVSRKVHTKRFAILGLIIVWFVSLSVVCPQLIVQRIEPRIKIDFNTHDILGISHVCVETFPKPEKYDRKIFSLTIFVGAYLVPVFVMAFTYGAIAHRLWVQQPIGDILANPRNHTRSIKQKRKVIKMLMLLVVAFTVLWFPFFTASLYQEFVETDSTFRITLVILQLVGYSNCCFNPIIYTFLNKKFQLEFKKIFCRRKRRVIASIHVVQRRSNSNSHSVRSNPHSVHSNPNSSSHNDVIVQGLKTPP